MTAITITDLENAKLDVDHIAAIATSTGATATDRLGNVKSTIKGATDSLAADVAEVEARKVTALAIDIPAAIATVAAINNRGAWAATTAYALKDIALTSGTWYMCILAHTSSASFATDASSKWRVYQGITSGDLAAPTGASLVGYENGKNVSDIFTGLKSAGGLSAFIETYISQIGFPAVPANLAAVGAESWIATITSGAAGATSITCTNNTISAGAGNLQWPCVVELNDGSFDVNLVTGDNGTGVFALHYPLRKAGVRLYPRWDAAEGQHMTSAGTKAYAEHIYRQLDAVCTSNKFLTPALFAQQPSNYQTLMTLNAASTSYGRVITGSHVTELLPATGTANSIFNGRMNRANREPGLVSVGVALSGHGIVGKIATGRKRGYVESYVCTAAATGTLTVRGSGKVQLIGYIGATEYVINEMAFSDNCTRFVAPFHGYDSVEIRVLSTINGLFYMQAEDVRCWITDQPFEPLIKKTGKIVTFGDSWTAYFGGGIATRLQELIRADAGTATVVNRGVGGMTTLWALDWIYDVIEVNNPTQIVFHFFTNDVQDLGAATYLDPQGVAKPLNVNSTNLLVANLYKLAAICQANGVQPIIMMPAGRASASGAVNQQIAATQMRRGAYEQDSPQVAASELTDATSYINKVGKFAGRRVTVGVDYFLATGPLASDPWKNPQNNRLGVVEAVAYKAASFDKPTAKIGTDTNADGLSDGITIAGWGAPPTVAHSISAGVQLVTHTYIVSNSSGASRYEFTSPVISGNVYLVIVENKASTPATTLGIDSRPPGLGIGTIANGSIFSGITGDSRGSNNFVIDDSGNALHYTKYTASATGNYGLLLYASIPHATVPVGFVLGIARVNVINLTEWAASAGISLSDYSDFDLFKLLNASLLITPPTNFLMKDTVTGLSKKITIANGVVTVV